MKLLVKIGSKVNEMDFSSYKHKIKKYIGCGY